MDKSVYIIYAIIVAGAVISAVYKRIKKAGNTGVNSHKKTASTYKQTAPQPTKQPAPKTLEEILKSLMTEQKPTQTHTQKVDEALVNTDKGMFKSTTFEDTGSLEEKEKQYYAQDTELSFQSEIEDYDEITDHHVHGVGFDKIEEVMEAEEAGEWDDIDWRKAVISAEILRRPEY